MRQVLFEVIHGRDLLGDFLQVVAFRSQSDRFPEHGGMPREDAAEKPQVGGSLGGQELPQTGPGKAQHLGQAQRGRHGRGGLAPIQALHQGPTAGKVLLQATIVNGVEDPRIAGLEDFFWHLGHKVELRIQVVAGGVATQAPFTGHAMIEVCAFEHGEQAFHSHRDGGVLNKLDVEVKHLRRLAIQPEDEAAHDLEALLLQGMDSMERILRVVFAYVLFLFSGDEGGRVGVSIPTNTEVKPACHGLHELVILHKIHAGFSTEIEGIVAVTLPGDEGPEQAQGISPVADKIIVHEKETPRARRYNRSNSASICSGVLVRGTRPYSLVISQNSQSNGHPRENCSSIEP